MTLEIAKKWEEVFANKDYAIALLKMSPEEALAELRSKGYDFTEDDMAEAANAINEISMHLNENGELSEDMLEDVAGGKGHVASYFAGVSLGIIVMTGAAAVALGW